MGEDLQWPFRGWHAVEIGELSVRELRRFYAPVYPGVYQPRGVELSAVERARAAWLWSRRRGVQRIDALMQATDVKVADVQAVIARHPGVRGLSQLRQTLDLVDGGAEYHRIFSTV